MGDDEPVYHKKKHQELSFYDNDFNSNSRDSDLATNSLATNPNFNQSLLTYLLMPDQHQPPNRQVHRVPLNRGQIERKSNDPKMGILPSLNTGFRPTERVDLPKPPTKK